MKKTLINIFAALTLIVGLASCSGKGQQLEQLDKIAFDLNTEFLGIAEATPALESVSFSMADDNVFNVGIKLADSDLQVSELDEPLVRYALAVYMKSHPGRRLDDLVNSLSQLEGTMLITITDADGASREYPMSTAILKRLIRSRLSELGYNDAKSAVTAIMASHTQQYAAHAGAASCTFALTGGFAEYTVEFPARSSYAQWNQSILAGRYKNLLKPQYETYGELRPFVTEVLTSLGIEGYRFIYTDPQGQNPVRAALPWRLLE